SSSTSRPTTSRQMASARSRSVTARRTGPSVVVSGSFGADRTAAWDSTVIIACLRLTPRGIDQHIVAEHPRIHGHAFAIGEGNVHPAADLRPGGQTTPSANDEATPIFRSEE